MSGIAFPAFAQNGPGQGGQGNGQSYGGPPPSQEERAARQSACQEKNDGICPNGSLQSNCPGQCKGKGQGMAPA